MRNPSIPSAGAGRGPWARRTSGGRQRQRLRLGLGLLAFGAGLVGVWALVAPRSFFDDFPGLGLTWVSELPRYSEHLVRDVGALNLAFAVLLLWAASGLDRNVVRAVLVAWLVYSIPHFVFHLVHLDRYKDDNGTTQIVVLAVGIALPLLLLFANERLERRPSLMRY